MIFYIIYRIIVRGTQMEKVDVSSILETSDKCYKYNIDGVGGIGVSFQKSENPIDPLSDTPYIYCFPVKPSKDREKEFSTWSIEPAELIETLEKELNISINDKKRRKIESLHYPCFLYFKSYINGYNPKVPDVLSLVTILQNDISFYSDEIYAEPTDEDMQSFLQDVQPLYTPENNTLIKETEDEFSLDFDYQDEDSNEKDDFNLSDDSIEENFSLDVLDADDLYLSESEEDESFNLTDNNANNINNDNNIDIESETADSLEIHEDSTAHEKFDDIDEIEAVMVSEYVFHYKVGNVYDVTVFNKDGEVLGKSLNECMEIPNDEGAYYLAESILMKNM